MLKIVISDTSTLILFQKIEQFDLLEKLYRAKQDGLIEKVKPLIDRLLATNFRISEKIIKEILTLNNEDACH